MPTKKPEKLCAVNTWHSSPDNPDVHPLITISGKLKDFENDDGIITTTKQRHRRAGPEFYHAGIQALVPRWHKAVERDRDYVKK
jgi:hypothetical protein